MFVGSANIKKIITTIPTPSEVGTKNIRTLIKITRTSSHPLPAKEGLDPNRREPFFYLNFSTGTQNVS